MTGGDCKRNKPRSMDGCDSKRNKSSSMGPFKRISVSQYLCCPLVLKPVGVSCNHGHCIMMTFFRHCGFFFVVQCGVRFCTIYMFDGYWYLFFFFILTQICQGTIFVVPVISTSLFILDSAVFGALSHLFVMMVCFFSSFQPAAPLSPPLQTAIHVWVGLRGCDQDY